MKIGMLDLRNEVVVAVQGIENEDLLRKIMELNLSGNHAEPYALSDEQNARIEVARKQYKNGQVRSHKSAMQETKQWLLLKP
jgi:hypothetical protein